MRKPYDDFRILRRWPQRRFFIGVYLHRQRVTHFCTAVNAGREQDAAVMTRHQGPGTALAGIDKEEQGYNIDPLISSFISPEGH